MFQHPAYSVLEYCSYSLRLNSVIDSIFRQLQFDTISVKNIKCGSMFLYTHHHSGEKIDFILTYRSIEYFLSRSTDVRQSCWLVDCPCKHCAHSIDRNFKDNWMKYVLIIIRTRPFKSNENRSSTLTYPPYKLISRMQSLRPETILLCWH